MREVQVLLRLAGASGGSKGMGLMKGQSCWLDNRFLTFRFQRSNSSGAGMCEWLDEGK